MGFAFRVSRFALSIVHRPLSIVRQAIRYNIPMRIALLAPFGLQPKATVSARMMPLAHALAARGHMVRIIIPPWDDPSASPEGTSITNVFSSNASSVAGVHTVTLPLPAHLPNSLTLTYGLVHEALAPTTQKSKIKNQKSPEAALATFRAEVAHVFKPVGYSGLAGFALSALRIPWVLDVDDWEGPGGFADKNLYSLAERASVHLMEAFLPRLARAVTAASRTLEARAWNMGIPRDRVGYMPNGVSHERYNSWSHYSRNTRRVTRPLTATYSPLPVTIRKQYNLQQGPVILLYTRFAEFPYVWPLHVLKRVISQHPTAKVLVVGSGFFNEEAKLRADAERMGLSDRVAITGRVPEDALPAYLSLADVAIYPMADTLLNRAKSPVKVIEPMLMGIPVVAHRVGQAAEFVGDAGVLVEPGNLEEMACAVSDLLKDRHRRNLLGAMAEQRVWSRFNWETLSGVAERMYEIALHL
jgi:glycosyltransferase involved in cell wall biosynthesis